MSFIVRILGLANGEPSPLDGMYLKAYDPHAHGGVGLIEGTPHRRRAMEFEDLTSFHALYVQAHGTRPDGKPNRPITAYNLQTERR